MSNETQYNFWDDEVAIQELYGNPPDLQRYSRKPMPASWFKRLITKIKKLLTITDNSVK